jgi:hypothetical protein
VLHELLVVVHAPELAAVVHACRDVKLDNVSERLAHFRPLFCQLLFWACYSQHVLVLS